VNETTIAYNSQKSGAESMKNSNYLFRTLNSREISSRHEELYPRIRKGFKEKEGASTDQSVIMDYLNL